METAKRFRFTCKGYQAASETDLNTRTGILRNSGQDVSRWLLRKQYRNVKYSILVFYIWLRLKIKRKRSSRLKEMGSVFILQTLTISGFFVKFIMIRVAQSIQPLNGDLNVVIS